MTMNELFSQILSMSLVASIVILAVMLLRLPLKKAPKLYSYALWAVVAFRLICPLAIESRVSAIPAEVNTAISAVITEYEEEIQGANRQMQTMISGDKAPDGAFRLAFSDVSLSSLELYFASLLWPVGIGVMLLRGIVQTLRLKRRLRGSSEIEPGLFESDIKTPFLFGLLRPKIYIPAELSGDERRYVIAHERTHLRRRDHWVKFAAYLILCLHWFNPLVLAAFLLMSADMEMSCDERVLKELGFDTKKAYSLSLLSLSSERRIIAGSPVAFGEGGIKARIKNVLNFRKPSRWIVTAAVIVVIAVSVGFAMDRAQKDPGKDDANIPEATQILDNFHSEAPQTPQVSPAVTPAASYDETEVAYPQLQVYVHANGRLFNIHVPEDIAADVQASLDAAVPLTGLDNDNDIIRGTLNGDVRLPHIFYYTGEEYYQLIGNAAGQWGLGIKLPIEATAAANALLDLAAEYTGWSFDNDITRFSDIAYIEVMLGKKVFHVVENPDNLLRFEDFMQNSLVTTTASKTQNQVIELRCVLTDGRTVSVFADAWAEMLWIPPVDYKLYGYGDDANALLDILGLDSWPEEVLSQEEYPYPEGFFDDTMERVAPPPSGA
jgi:beta-lactamase regulating signal transducer with metallopeptidase domain